MKSNKSSYAVWTAIIVVILVLIAGALLMNKQANRTSTADMSAPASLALVNMNSGETASVGNIEHIRWTSTNYAAPTVSIDIIRKVSDNPISYELVRQVASSTENDGDAVWVPAMSDVGPDTYVVVGCAISDQACTATPLPPQPLAVVNTGNSADTAAAYQAIEQLNNK
jgi:hypothetical protein